MHERHFDRELKQDMLDALAERKAELQEEQAQDQAQEKEFQDSPIIGQARSAGVFRGVKSSKEFTPKESWPERKARLKRERAEKRELNSELEACLKAAGISGPLAKEDYSG